MMEDLIYGIITQAVYDYMEETRLFSMYRKKFEVENKKFSDAVIYGGVYHGHIDSYYNNMKKHESEIKSLEEFFKKSNYMSILNIDAEDIIASLKTRMDKDKYPYRTDSFWLRKKEAELKRKKQELELISASSEF